MIAPALVSGWLLVIMAFVTTFDVALGSWLGQHNACIVSPTYGEKWMGGVYREVKRPERLVYTWAWEGAMPLAGAPSTSRCSRMRRRGSSTGSRSRRGACPGPACWP